VEKPIKKKIFAHTLALPDDLFADWPAPLQRRITAAAGRRQRPVAARLMSLPVPPHQPVDGVRPDVQELFDR